MYDSFAVVFLRELVQQPDRVKILCESRWLEFWIGSPQVVALEFGVGSHPAAEQSAANRAVGQHPDSFPRAVSKDRFFDRALEKIIRRLRGMYRRDQPEFVHLLRREV